MSTTTITLYLESKTRLDEKIKAIELLIDTMFIRLTEATNGEAAVTDEYSLDDGQIKLRTKYRNITDVEAGIKSLEKLKQRYINKRDGHVVLLRDVRGLS